MIECGDLSLSVQSDMTNSFYNFSIISKVTDVTILNNPKVIFYFYFFYF